MKAMKKRGFAPFIVMLILAVILGGGFYTYKKFYKYEKFYKTGSTTSGVAQDLYEGLVKVSGTYSYNQFVGAYPKVEFLVDDVSKSEIPREAGDNRTPHFTFDNTDGAVGALKIDSSKLGNGICEIKGAATVVISGYKVLKAELGGSDTAHLDKVLSSSTQELSKCSN